MSDWDLLTPGIGLTSIGIVGVGISLAGIAKTFIDGMHAVSLLTLFIGLIFLSAGIFKDGFPRSPRAKSATFITLGFLVTFGIAAAVTISTTVPSIFAYIGLMMVIAIPATVIIVASYKESPYVKAISVIFIAAAVVGGGTFYVFGLVSPKVPSEQDAVQGQAGSGNTSSTSGNASGSASVASGNASNATGSSSGPVVSVSIPPGASAQGNPSYDPAILNVSKGDSIEWTNNDNTPHTVTSSVDEGQTFDSSLIMAGDTFLLQTSDLSESSYDYFCTLHPFMKASFVFEGDNATTNGNQSNLNSSNTENGNQSNLNSPPVTNVSATSPDLQLTLVQYSRNSLIGLDYTSTTLANKLDLIGY
jgi:plastocyanin